MSLATKEAPINKTTIPFGVIVANAAINDGFDSGSVITTSVDEGQTSYRGDLDLRSKDVHEGSNDHFDNREINDNNNSLQQRRQLFQEQWSSDDKI